MQNTTHNYYDLIFYIIKTKDLYYVGQGKAVLDRVNHHFSGRGNGDVYADYKYGDFFTIQNDQTGKIVDFISLKNYERNTIAYYDAYNKGYNRTRGNRG